MGHRRNELPCRFPGQLRIGIQRKDIPDLCQDARSANNDRKDIPAPSPDKGIQRSQLPPFPLIAHPFSLPAVPGSRPVKEKEPVLFRVTVFFIQRPDPLACQFQQPLIRRQRLRGGIRKIGQQPIMKMGFRVGEISDLQRFD